MKTFYVALAAVMAVSLTAGYASAQCTINVPAKAKGGKMSFVRNYAECPSTQHPSANTTTGGGTAACSPVTAKGLGENPGAGELTDWFFGPKGGCDVKFSYKNEECANLGAEAGPCANFKIDAKCKDIHDAGGALEQADLAGPGGLVILAQATINDETNGPLTVIDFPVSAPFGDFKKGGAKLKTTSTAILLQIFEVDAADLPSCSSVELISMKIMDDLGRDFAWLGAGGKDKHVD